MEMRGFALRSKAISLVARRSGLSGFTLRIWARMSRIGQASGLRHSGNIVLPATFWSRECLYLERAGMGAARGPRSSLAFLERGDRGLAESPALSPKSLSAGTAGRSSK
jgi:hypothetical protein